MKKFCKTAIALVLVFALGISVTFPSIADEEDIFSSVTVAENAAKVQTYSDYLTSADVQSAVKNGETVTLTTENAVKLTDGSYIENNFSDTGKSAVVINDTGSAEWTVTLSENTACVIDVTYMSAEDGAGDMELSFEIDGEVPFKQVQTVGFKRTFEQSKGDFETNISGNDITPTVKEISVWKSCKISDSTGYIADPFVFYLSAGTHSFCFLGSRGCIAINEICLAAEQKSISYNEYKKTYEKSNAQSKEEAITIEAEKFSYKNSATVLPVSDRSSVDTTPCSAFSLKLNSLGGTNWKVIGDSVTWEFEVPESGIYNIALRSKQNFVDGVFTSRKIYIDGVLPFEELSSLRFDYSSDWQFETLGNEEESYGFYLTEGTHTLTMEAVAGDISEVLSVVENAISSLNGISRKIVMVVGKSPDTNRNYHFENLIPNELEEMAQIRDELSDVVEYIEKQVGASGSYTSIIRKIIIQLDTMCGQPKSIAKNFEQFKSNLGSLSSWLQTAIEQPLQLDKIVIAPQERIQAAKKTSGFFSRAAFSLKCFLASYVTDYSVIGSENVSAQKSLKVWIQTGRDQGTIIRELIDNSFTTKGNDVSVALEIVSTGTLLPSVLSGESADVVLDNVANVPIDYAIRGAVYDLTQFEDFEDVFSRFSSAAVKQASYKGHVYAMPQTFSFFMMFCRTDILDEYGYTAPKTWTELTEMIPSMQRNGLEIGVTATLDMYATMLYQRGGKLYLDDGASTNLDSKQAINAFIDLTELYTLYDLSVSFNFANRFRTGEMPIAITTYTSYNELTAFAPEIKGLWEMLPIPGTLDENGEVVNTSVGTGTYMILLNNSDKKELAWEFMKWFMSTETQGMYSQRMESILGNCAKVNTANTEALSKMTWSSSEYKNLYSQLERVDAVPQVPGGYYLDRVFNFAFNRVYNSSASQNMGEDPSEVLSEYIVELNDELQRKQKEFELQ